MTTENSLFENAPKPAQDQTAGNPANTNDQSNLFYVGEGKKYGSVDELDKAYAHANEHIGKIESENETLRKQLAELGEKTSAVDKVLEALRGQQHKEQDQAPAQQQAVQEPNIEDVVANLLAQREAQTTAQKNADAVRTALAAKFGDKAGDVYKARASELGVNLDDLSKQSPDAVLALFDAKPVQQHVTPQSSFNTAHLQRSSEDESSPEALFKAGKISREQKFRMQWERELKK